MRCNINMSPSKQVDFNINKKIQLKSKKTEQQRGKTVFSHARFFPKLHSITGGFRTSFMF